MVFFTPGGQTSTGRKKRKKKKEGISDLSSVSFKEEGN